jgi:hypothetical protein
MAALALLLPFQVHSLVVLKAATDAGLDYAVTFSRYRNLEVKEVTTIPALVLLLPSQVHILEVENCHHCTFKKSPPLQALALSKLFRSL